MKSKIREEVTTTEDVYEFTCDECGKKLGKIYPEHNCPPFDNDKFERFISFNAEINVPMLGVNNFTDYCFYYGKSRYDLRYYKHFCTDCKKKKSDELKKILLDFGFEEN